MVYFFVMNEKIFTFLSFLIVGMFFLLFVFFISSDIDNSPYSSEGKEGFQRTSLVF